MSLQLMRERIKIRGCTPREEMIRDGQNLLKEELEHDSSYSPTILFYSYDYNRGLDGECAKLRIYNRKNDSTYGEIQNFTTTYDNPITVGMYFHDTKDDSYWIATESFNVNDIHYEGKMIRCIYDLRWQDKSGNIIERKGISVDQTKYSNGEKSNNAITIGNNQYGLLLPVDSESKKLKREMRFAFDFEDAEEPDIYRLSNRKIKLKDNIIQLSFTFDAFDKDTDKRVTLDDGKKVWICNYTTSSVPITPPIESNEMTISILGSDVLKIGRKKSWSVEFKDKDGNSVEFADWSWSVKSDFDIDQTVSNKIIELSVDDEDSADESILLQILSADDNVVAEKEIMIMEGW